MANHFLLSFSILIRLFLSSNLSFHHHISLSTYRRLFLSLNSSAERYMSPRVLARLFISACLFLSWHVFSYHHTSLYILCLSLSLHVSSYRYLSNLHTPLSIHTSPLHVFLIPILRKFCLSSPYTIPFLQLFSFLSPPLYSFPSLT